MLPNTRRYNLFISHSWGYSDAYDRLIELLDKHPSFFYNNLSVPKDDPIHYAPSENHLYAAIKERIQHADVVLILAGVYATHSKWINLEIKAAKELSMFSGLLSTLFKPIIAIEPWGAERTSQTVKDSATEIVSWNTDSVVAAIKRVAP